MERPWSYYLLLIAAWLAGLWGLWLVGEAWLNWPLDGSEPLRDAARSRAWTGAVLLGGAAALGGLASVVRLLHDGVAALLARGAITQPKAEAPAAAVVPERSVPPARPAAAAAPASPAPAVPASEPARLMVGGLADEPKAEAAAAPRIEPRRAEPSLAPVGPVGPRLDPPRDAARRPADDPPGRREPKLLPDG